MRRSFLCLIMAMPLRNARRLSSHKIFYLLCTLGVLLTIYVLMYVTRSIICSIKIKPSLPQTECPDIPSEAPDLFYGAINNPKEGVHSLPGVLYPSVYESPIVRPSSVNGQKRPIRIPHIIHQTYKSRQVPRALANFISSWPRLHPDWTYVFWTDADIDVFIKKFYPAHEHTLDGISSGYMKGPFGPIYRSDLVRYLILDFFGGVYADLDTESIKPLDPLTRDHYVVVSREPEAFAISSARDTITQACNAFMMSAPGHPVWSTVIETIIEKVKNDPRDPVQVTGPVTLDQALRRYRCRKPWTRQLETSVFLAPSPVFYSYEPWMEDKVRIRAIIDMCGWLRIAGIKTQQVYHICEVAEKHNRVDWSFVPKVAPSNRFVLHHGSQVYAVDRLNIADNDKFVNVSTLAPNVISFQQLLERQNNLGKSFRSVRFT